MKKSKIVLPSDMDKECIALCDALNELLHTETIESCCGHLKSPFRIWFRCSSFTYLAIITRAIDRIYSGTQKEWKIVSESGDSHPRCLFMLTSVEPYETYTEMTTDTNQIIANILYWRENFLEYFQSDEEVTNPGKNLAMTWEDLDKYQEAMDNWDWEKYRRKAAKDILCAILSTKQTADDSDVKIAIEISEELIRQLRH